MNGLRHRTAPASKSDKQACPIPVNPFVHSIHLGALDRLKVYILTVVLLPVRLVVVFVCLFIAYLLACIGTIGLSQDDLIAKPMKGWRR